MKNQVKLFEQQKVRTHWDEKEEKWYFSVIDVIEILSGSSIPKRYWSDLKKKLASEGSEVYEKIVRLKMLAEDGKLRETDVADTEQLLRIIQSIPSPKAEPFKQWLAKVGYERMQEIVDPEQSLERARENWQKLGRSEKWIQQRMTGQETRNKLTDYWKESGAFLIAASHLETDAEQLLFGFEEVIGKQVNVFGGMTGDDYAFQEQHVFTNNKSTNRGVVALALDEDKIIIKGKATCGWKAVGTERTVTKSEGNHVFTVDDILVLHIRAKYGGLENIEEKNTQVAMEIAVNFPLQLQRKVGDPVMRPGLLIKWEDRSFVCSGSVPQGSKVRFSLPPDFDVMEKVIKGVEELKDTEMPEADALVCSVAPAEFWR